MERIRETDRRVDALVAGARVAGAATAMLLARAGMRVLVVDKARYGSDTTSTHALMRAGVMQLKRWGLLDRLTGSGTPAIRRTTFHYGGETIEVAIPDRDGVDALYAPRRTVLDTMMADAARDAGAHVVHGVRVDGLIRDSSGRVRGVELVDGSGGRAVIDAGIVVGADGVRSTVAGAASAAVIHAGAHAGAVVYGYFEDTGFDATHWYYNRGVAAGAIPTNGDAACVFAAMPPGRYATLKEKGPEKLFMEVVEETDPGLAQRVRGARRAGNLHPFAGRPGFIRRSWGRGWALVGDAGCFKDPITAHGMTDALRDAELLARALVDGREESLARYQAERDAFAVEFMELSDRIASFDWTLDEVKPMHRLLSKLMNRECDIIRAFDAGSGESAAA